MTTIFWLLLGLVLGAAFLVRARAQAGAEARVLAIGLVVAAAIYVSFALAGTESGGIAIEAIGVVLCGALAWLDLRYSLLWLSAGGRFIPYGMVDCTLSRAARPSRRVVRLTLRYV